MRTFITLSLIASFSANIWLVSRSLGADDWQSTHGESKSEIAVQHAADIGNAALQDSSPNECSKAATLVVLERAAFEPARRAAQTYWSTGGSFELDYVRAIQAANDKVRAELVKICGPDAVSEPLFWRIFRPMDPMYSFLSSTQQVAVQRSKLERDKRLYDAQKAAGPGASVAIDAGLARSADESYRAALAQILGEAGRFELALRDSPEARELRESGVDFSETEFRESFRLLAGMRRPDAGIDDVVAAREGLRTLLGDRRFAELWSTRDPMFARLESAARKHDLDESGLIALYSLVNDFQDERMRAARLTRLDPRRAAETIEAIDADERHQLQRLVGDELTAEILRGRAIDSARLFRGAGADR